MGKPRIYIIRTAGLPVQYGKGCRAFNKGLVVGQFTEIKTGIDKNIEEIISNAVAGLDIPVLYGVESGHGEPNLPLYLGRQVKLEVTPTTATITFKE